jgi:hypothetical protein
MACFPSLGLPYNLLQQHRYVVLCAACAIKVDATLLILYILAVSLYPLALQHLCSNQYRHIEDALAAVTLGVVSHTKRRQRPEIWMLDEQPKVFTALHLVSALYASMLAFLAEGCLPSTKSRSCLQLLECE